MSCNCKSMLRGWQRLGLLASGTPGPFFFFFLLLPEMVQIVMRLPPVFVAYSDFKSSFHAFGERSVFWIADFIPFVAFFDFTLCLSMLLWITLFQVSVKITSVEEIVSTSLCNVCDKYHSKTQHVTMKRILACSITHFIKTLVNMRKFSFSLRS